MAQLRMSTALGLGSSCRIPTASWTSRRLLSRREAASAKRPATYAVAIGTTIAEITIAMAIAFCRCELFAVTTGMSIGFPVTSVASRLTCNYAVTQAPRHKPPPAPEPRSVKLPARQEDRASARPWAPRESVRAPLGKPRPAPVRCPARDVPELGCEAPRRSLIPPRLQRRVPPRGSTHAAQSLRPAVHAPKPRAPPTRTNPPPPSRKPGGWPPPPALTPRSPHHSPGPGPRSWGAATSHPWHSATPPAAPGCPATASG